MQSSAIGMFLRFQSLKDDACQSTVACFLRVEKVVLHNMLVLSTVHLVK